jgi:hypothetical protein
LPRTCVATGSMTVATSDRISVETTLGGAPASGINSCTVEYQPS